MQEPPEVLIVGAGVAGVAAAGRLAAAGRRVLVLEARGRLGGRVHTMYDPASPWPIELGAEFVQGESEALAAVIREAGLALRELPERHEGVRRGSRRPLPEIERVVARLLGPAPRDHPDRPVAELLTRAGARGTPDELAAARQYVEGFHAADLERMGTHALADAEVGDGPGERQYRLLGGYRELVRALAARLHAARNRVRTRHVVTGVAWRAGEVRVRVRTPGAETELIAPQAVLTLPIGVIRGSPGAEGVPRIEPLPSGWGEALQALEMGAAHRVVLRFDHAWWAGGLSEPPAFLHGSGPAFPVWWTALPSRAPLLTGWSGGPSALALASLEPVELARRALESAAAVTDCDPGWLAARLQGVYHHDWVADPYSRGAYSYGGVGALAARALLARPVEGTLALAGEALASGSMVGTVAGALASGLAAASALLAEG